MIKTFQHKGLERFFEKGDHCWSIIVNGNWRITFEFRDGAAYIVNYEDYH